ncbi:hypothetical protein BDZ97DRAFT_1920928 [Flammula alnicola]|nr:hypothetical protein BDZ97DRAFT_1920928 [Flammula alnicola]
MAWATWSSFCHAKQWPSSLQVDQAAVNAADTTPAASSSHSPPLPMAADSGSLTRPQPRPIRKSQPEKVENAIQSREPSSPQLEPKSVGSTTTPASAGSAEASQPLSLVNPFNALFGPATGPSTRIESLRATATAAKVSGKATIKSLVKDGGKGKKGDTQPAENSKTFAPGMKRVTASAAPKNLCYIEYLETHDPITPAAFESYWKAMDKDEIKKWATLSKSKKEAGEALRCVVVSPRRSAISPSARGLLSQYHDISSGRLLCTLLLAIGFAFLRKLFWLLLLLHVFPAYISGRCSLRLKTRLLLLLLISSTGTAQLTLLHVRLTLATTFLGAKCLSLVYLHITLKLSYWCSIFLVLNGMLSSVVTMFTHPTPDTLQTPPLSPKPPPPRLLPRYRCSFETTTRSGNGRATAAVSTQWGEEDPQHDRCYIDLTRARTGNGSTDHAAGAACNRA